MDKLISYIVPCYNGAKTIHRLLESFLCQTYTQLEIIIVDDGSTDESARVIESYRPRFEALGMRLEYFYQENKGLGGAIDSGLKLFHGDYLCWIDVDDFLSPEASEHRMKFLEENPKYAVVSSDAYIFLEGDLEKPIARGASKLVHNADENQFWHLLTANSLFMPGCHMVRTEDFLKVNPTRSIYPARRGQNWQLLLPVYYRFPRAFLNEPLFNYLQMKNSMSKDHGDPKKELYRCDEHLDIITQTLKRMEMTEQDRIKAEHLVQTLFARKKLYIAGRNGLKDIAKEQYRRLKEMNENNKKDCLQLWCARCWAVRKLYSLRK